MNRFALIALASAVSLITSQITTVYAARNIGTSEFGQFVIALLVATVVSVFVDVGGRLHYAARMTGLKGVETRHTYFLATTRRLTSINLILTLPLVFIGILISDSTDLLFLGALMGLLGSVYVNVFSLRQIAITNGSAQTINAFVEFSRFIFLLLLLQFTSMHGLAILAISQLASRAIGIVMLIGPSAPRLLVRIPRRVRIYALYRKSSAIFWSGVLSLVNMRAGDALVATMLPPARMAELNVAMQLPAAGLRVFELVKLNVMQELSATKAATIAKRLVPLCLLLQLALFFTAPTLEALFVWIYTEKFRDAQLLFIGLASWLIFSLGNYTASLTLIVKGASRQELNTNKISLLISPLLYLVSVYTLGVQGVVVAMWVLTTISICLNIYWLSKLDN